MKFTLIFFTFLGIYTSHAQDPAKNIDSGFVKNTNPFFEKPVKMGMSFAKEKPAIRLFPNPATNKVEVEIKGFEPGFVQILLMDKNGKFVRNEKRLLFSGSENVVMMFSEKPGLYYILLKQNEKYLKTKLIIQ